MLDPIFTTRFITYFVVCLATLGLLFLRKDLLEIIGVLRRRFGSPAAGRSGLAVTEIARIDESRRLLLVTRDQTEHLVVVGGPNDVIVESRVVGGQEPVAPIVPPRESWAGEIRSELRLLVELPSQC